jgi:hypothetical protein
VLGGARTECSSGVEFATRRGAHRVLVSCRPGCSNGEACRQGGNGHLLNGVCRSVYTFEYLSLEALHQCVTRWAKRAGAFSTQTVGTTYNAAYTANLGSQQSVTTINVSGDSMVFVHDPVGALQAWASTGMSRLYMAPE